MGWRENRVGWRKNATTAEVQYRVQLVRECMYGSKRQSEVTESYPHGVKDSAWMVQFVGAIGPVKDPSEGAVKDCLLLPRIARAKAPICGCIISASTELCKPAGSSMLRVMGLPTPMSCVQAVDAARRCSKR